MTKFYLSRRPSGTYMLTALPVIRARIKGTRTREDLYLAPGEPIGILHLCESGVLAALGRELALFETVEVVMTFEEIQRIKVRRRGP